MDLWIVDLWICGLDFIRYSIADLGAVAYIYEEKSHRLLASVYHKKKLRRAVKEIAVLAPFSLRFTVTALPQFLLKKWP